jgi:hypothetical protein
MQDQSGGFYRLLGNQSLDQMEQSLNFILNRIADRLDRLEGLKGYTTFYKSAFDIITDLGMTPGYALRASSDSHAEMDRLGVTDIEGAAPTIDSGLSAQINLERSLISIIDGENDYVIHQFPAQWLEYNSDVFMFMTHENPAFEQNALGGVTYWAYAGSILDDASITLPKILTDYSGHGFIRISASAIMEQFVEFDIDSTGTVYLNHASTGVVANANTDTKLCIGTAAAQNPIIIKNRLGATKKIVITFWYSQG